MDVEVVVTDQVVLRVVDDGIGPPAPDAPRGHGLKNMEARAARHGGRFELRAGPPRAPSWNGRSRGADPDAGAGIGGTQRRSASEPVVMRRPDTNSVEMASTASSPTGAQRAIGTWRAASSSVGSLTSVATPVTATLQPE